MPIKKYLFGFILCVLVFFCNSFYSKALTVTDKPSYFLVINTYTETFVWSNDALNIISKHVISQGHSLRVEYLNTLLLDTNEKVKSQQESLFNKYKECPKGIIFIGNGAWSLMIDSIQSQWRDIPLFLYTSEAMMENPESYMDKTLVPGENQKSVEQALKGYNATALIAPFYPRGCLELINELIPGLKRLLFISDQRFVSRSEKKQIAEIVSSHFPEVHVEYLTEGEVSTDSLFTILSTPDPLHSTAVMYFSWIMKENYMGNSFLSNNLHFSINSASALPVFTLYDMGTADGYSFGGYYTSNEVLGLYLEPFIQAVTDGQSLRDIPVLFVNEPQNYLNYQAVKRILGDKVKSLKNVTYYNAPKSFFEANKYFLITIAAILFIFFLSVWFVINRSKGKIRERELSLLSRYRDLFNNMPLPYIREQLDTENPLSDIKILDANLAFGKIANRNEVINKRRYEIGDIIGNNYEYHLASVVKVLETRKAFTYEYLHEKNHSYYSVVIMPTSEPDIVDIFLIDITDIKKFQEYLESTNHKLSMALNAADMLPWRYNLSDGKIIYESRDVDWKKTVEDTNTHQITLDEYFELIHPAFLTCVKQAFDDLCEGKIKKIRKEYCLNRKEPGSNEYEWEEIQVMTEYNESGEPKVLIGSTISITERKRLEYELRRAKEKAEESNKLKSAFLANMSHEIRTPLNAIVGFSNILASTEDAAEKKEFVDIIENNNSLLLQLINDILDLSKIEAGTLEFTCSYADINALMKDLEQSTRMKSKNEDVEIVFKDRLPICIAYTDRNRLAQLVSNLLNNALKFTQTGSIVFGYTLTEDNMLRFFVQDTGCGIPDDKQKDIFGRFIKLNSFAQGTGLGLSICEMIVSQMNGSIGVKSKVGEGSFFWFTIPYQPELQDILCKNEEKAIPLMESVKRDDLTVLIAEDNPSNYKLFESILKSDYKLLHAWNGLEAVELFRKYNPQIILMDIKMPVMDGYEATAEIRKYSATVPILAVTANAFSQDEARIVNSGFDAYTAKPINEKVLKEKIWNLLDHRVILM